MVQCPFHACFNRLLDGSTTILWQFIELYNWSIFFAHRRANGQTKVFQEVLADLKWVNIFTNQLYQLKQVILTPPPSPLDQTDWIKNVFFFSHLTVKRRKVYEVFLFLCFDVFVWTCASLSSLNLFFALTLEFTLDLIHNFLEAKILFWRKQPRSFSLEIHPILRAEASLSTIAIAMILLQLQMLSHVTFYWRVTTNVEIAVLNCQKCNQRQYTLRVFFSMVSRSIYRPDRGKPHGTISAVLWGFPDRQTDRPTDNVTELTWDG